MPGLDLLVMFDDASLRTVQGLAGFQGFYEMRLYGAGEASLEALQREAVDYMWSTFKNPQGPLEDSLEVQMFTPYEGHLATNMPYGRRRNWGFVGMVDALGRVGTDEGIEYMEHSIIYTAAEVVGNYQRAVNQTVLDLGGTP